ncbi:hypothetical protein [Streptomyces sp. NBC_00847]|uniref:hypothetical protein n=1 Tax=Streptomyces sp. NBC_00847 TaxID=2975850 RepID=UPI00225DD7EB|nr:hypothetical protein [Streptomyces sp. NBC_00847]MCX4885889.1 hypothetical protein [Streptomyces sp. NBC_00847]
MTTTITTITGAEAYARAVEHAEQAEQHIGIDSRIAEQHAAVATAYAAIAQAERAASNGAPAGCYPNGGWKRHTHPHA